MQAGGGRGMGVATRMHGMEQGGHVEVHGVYEGGDVSRQVRLPESALSL